MTLTPRQLEILRLSAEGLTCHAIGRKLYIGENTVRTHRKAAWKRLGANTAAHAVAIAYQRGILGDQARQIDSARAWAVELEQELAHVREELSHMGKLAMGAIRALPSKVPDGDESERVA